MSEVLILAAERRHRFNRRERERQAARLRIMERRLDHALRRRAEELATAARRRFPLDERSG